MVSAVNELEEIIWDLRYEDRPHSCGDNAEDCDGWHGMPDPDKTIVEEQTAKLNDYIERQKASHTDHLFSVIRSLGYKIDRKAVNKLSKEWNDNAAKHMKGSV